MSDDIWVAIFTATTSVLVAVIQTSPLWLGAAAAIIIAVLFREPLIEKFHSAQRLAFAGLEIEVAAGALNTARANAPVPGFVSRALVRSTRERAEDLAGLRILWVDDNPDGNYHERRYLRAAGVTVVNALDTDSGLRELARDDYDIVITDMKRGDDPDAGRHLAEQARATGHRQPFVGYIGRVNPDIGRPDGFEQMTDRPDDLISAILQLAEARTT